MNNILEKTMNEALQYENIPYLPELLKENDIWIKAIVKVLKINGQENYAIARIDENLQPRIIKDFGSITQILRIDEIRPYLFLKPQYIRKMTKKEEVIEYLAKVYNKDIKEIESLSSAQRKAMLYSYFISLQVNTERL